MNEIHQLLRKLDLNLLVVFDALMQERSVSRAAELCFLSQPAMSNALSRLRDMLEDPLLVRTSAGMTPSPRAMALEAPIRSMLNQLGHQLQPPVAFDPLSTDRQFKIALTSYGENVILPKLNRIFWQQAPHATLDVSRLTQTLPISALEMGDIDLVIGVQEYLQPPKQLHSRHYLEDRLVCLARKNSIEGGEVSLVEFINKRHVYPTPLGVKANVVDEWLNRQELTRDIAISTHSYLVAARLITDTDYLLSLPYQIAVQLVELFPLDLLEPPEGFPIFQLNLIWHPLYENDPAIQWLLIQMDKVKIAQ